MASRIGVKEQENLFNLIGRTIKKRTECYAVGGTAMMFLNLKETTKDIDLVFKNKEDYEMLKKALIYLGAKETKSKIINPEKVSSILSLGNARFDLFLDYLIKFKLTKSITSRIIESHEFSNLIIKIVSPEDIILFKSFANREADKVDVSNILKQTNIDWKVVLEEAKEQEKISKHFFSAFLYDFLIEIKEDFKIEIPKDFMKKLKELYKNIMLEIEKKLKDKK